MNSRKPAVDKAKNYQRQLGGMANAKNREKQWKKEAYEALTYIWDEILDDRQKELVLENVSKNVKNHLLKTKF